MWFVHPCLVEFDFRGHAQYPAFAPNMLFFASGPSEVAGGAFWSFCIFVQNLSQLLLQSHIVSLYFVPGGEVYPGACTAAKGPRSQPNLSQLYFELTC